MEQKPTSFTFEIDSFFEKEDVIISPQFSSGGCEWYLEVFPKGDIVDEHLSMYLHVANPESLRLGWERSASYSFVLLNQSGKEIYRDPKLFELFCAHFSGSGLEKAVPLKKLQEKGILENNKLIIKVEVQVLEVVDERDVNGKEMLDICGFHVLYPQVIQVSQIFTKHPDIALNVKPKSQSVKTTYMNLLLNLIKKLEKPPRSFTKNELSNARNEWIDLTEAGFKLDWLKEKLDEISLERKKANADRVEELEEQNKNLKAELNKEKVKSANSVAKVLSLEQTVVDLKAELNKKRKRS